MKYVVNASWKHEQPVDEQHQRDYMGVLKSTLNSPEYLYKTIWYKIDAFTHGSVAIYKSKEAYESFMELNATQRDFAADERKVFMQVEYQGLAFAVHTDVD